MHLSEILTTSCTTVPAGGGGGGGGGISVLSYRVYMQMITIISIHITDAIVEFVVLYFRLWARYKHATRSCGEGKVSILGPNTHSHDV